jgi:hypothetical protein
MGYRLVTGSKLDRHQVKTSRVIEPDGVVGDAENVDPGEPVHPFGVLPARARD